MEEGKKKILRWRSWKISGGFSLLLEKRKLPALIPVISIPELSQTSGENGDETGKLLPWSEGEGEGAG